MNKQNTRMNRKKTVLISSIILLVAAGITVIIFLTEPEAKREGATKVTAMLVEVLEAERGTFKPEINATGTVQPSQEVILSPRVNGEIIERSPAFTPGGYVKKGEMLLRIDPSDYKNTLALRKSELQQAIADLNIEKGRQEIAKSDFRLVEDSLSAENRALVLRDPQLNAIQARVGAARAAVDQAELELRRTTIRAPFDAHIVSRMVNIGSQVAPGQDLGRLVGTDEYWIVATVPVSKLPWISFPDNNNPESSEVKIRNHTAREDGHSRTGYVYRLIGVLEDQTRLARILITVPNPLLDSGVPEDLSPLIIGSFVEVNIIGNDVENVVRLNRDYTRKNNTVWVMEGDTLNIKDIRIRFQDARYAYISEGLEEGEKVVTTNLTTVAEGVSLRTEENNADSQDIAFEDKE